ncbi:RMD1 family protein [Geothrix sp. 21YS21S-4]|uniref:RMD1 family protein n=1 Tax=Geothrix sp. 21YS21S-4 TaxID=3068889 RepID=UPI0027B9BB6D|nr:RMD1 family protein [Geothrix sp. 21YS21S-4]
MPLLSRIRPLLPEGDAREFSLQADYFDGQIDLKAFSAAHPHHAILNSNPLILEPRQGNYVYLSRFGGVVFWNCAGDLIQQVHDELKRLPGLSRMEEQARDTLLVRVGSTEDSVGFSEVNLRGLTLEKLSIVSLALAQSVALDHFEAAVSQAMARFQPVVHALSRDGKLAVPHRELLRIAGFAMEVRAVVLENLTLFDDPPETWESESLAHLDGALFDQFDLEERLGAIREKLAYLQDTGATFLGLLDTRKNHRLEWVIILLILVEILLAVGKDLFNLGAK